jgi:hypothetical protein
MRFREKADDRARVTSRVRCPRARAVVKGSGPAAEQTLVAPASLAIGLITVCLARVAIDRTWADRGLPAIVRATSVDQEHQATVQAISVAPELRAIVPAISVGQGDPTSDNRAGRISGNQAVPTSADLDSQVKTCPAKLVIGASGRIGATIT